MKTSSFYSDSFQLYLNNTSGIGFQIYDENVTLTIDSGELNSSLTLLTNAYKRGSLTFNSSVSGTFILSFSDGLKVWFDGAETTTGDSHSFSTTQHIIYWDTYITDVFSPYVNVGMGMGGFALVAVGVLFMANTLRYAKAEMGVLTTIALCFFAILCGCGLIVGWLW